MSPTLLFALLLLLTFAALLFFLKPTREESAVQRHLEEIEVTRVQDFDGTTILKREPFSSIPWLDDLLRQAPGTWSLMRLLKQAGSLWTVSTVITLSLLAFFFVWMVAYLMLSRLAFSAVPGAAAAFSPFLYLLILRDTRFRRCDALLPEAVDLMARALRAGHAVTAAMEMVGQEIGEPLAGEFRIVHEEQSFGLPMREAIFNLADRLPRDDVRFLATAILVQKETGGNLAQILDKTAAVMRERVRLRGQLRIYTAQGRLTGWILSCMPFVMFALISMINHDYESILFTDPLGIRVVIVGLIMMVLGVLAIRKIIDIKV